MVVLLYCTNYLYIYIYYERANTVNLERIIYVGLEIYYGMHVK